MTTGAAAVAGALRAHGVSVAFGLPGVHNLPLWPACAAAGIEIVGVRHEQTTVYAADGLARATGTLGVALTTTGPGAANTVGAVGEAWASHSPVVLVATDIPTTQRVPGVYRGALHECTAQASLFHAVTKSTIDVAGADALGPALHAAAAIALGPPSGPVYVGVPADLLTAPAPPAGPPLPAAPVEVPDVTPLVDAVAGSRRPLVWVGGGARHAGPEVTALAERLGAPVITTYQARGTVPAGHPLLVGAPPHEPPVTDLVRQADLAIVIGSDLDAMNTMGWRLPLPDRRVAINLDAVDAAKSYPMDAVVEADARVAGRLAAALDPRRAWAGDLAALTEDLRAELRAAPDTATAVDFLEGTERALPRQAVVFADMCIPGYWLAGHLRVHVDRHLHYPMGWGTLGFALPAAIGAATAARASGDPVVCVTGDGGVLFAIGELATVAQEGLPLTVVVVDDEGYGMLRFGHDGEAVGSELRSPDFAAVATGFGLATRSVRGVGPDFEDALADAVRSAEPTLVHVRARLYPPRSTSPRWPIQGG